MMFIIICLFVVFLFLFLTNLIKWFILEEEYFCNRSPIIKKEITKKRNITLGFLILFIITGLILAELFNIAVPLN